MRAKGYIVVLLVASVIGLSGCLGPEILESGHSRLEARATATSDGYGRTSEADDCEAGTRPDPADAYTDADFRYSNVVDGSESSERTVHVPVKLLTPLTARLRVALIHDSAGDVTFRLEKPLDLGTAAEEQVSGEKFMDEPEWFVMDQPVPGDWSFQIRVDGASSYTVAFYLH